MQRLHSESEMRAALVTRSVRLRSARVLSAVTRRRTLPAELRAPTTSRASVAAGGDPGSRLTRRQAEVLTLLARGVSVREIAAELGLSPTTVHKHVQGAIQTLRARGRLHAVVLAARAGEIWI